MEPREQYKTLMRKQNENFVNDQFGKLPPQAKDLEEAVIGACLTEPSEIYKALNILRPEYFYVDAHERIWRAIAFLNLHNKPVDMLTVTEQLRTTGDLDAAGGPYFISQLTNKVMSAANLEYHCYVVKEKWVARHAIAISTQCIRAMYEDTEDVFEALDKMQTEMLALNGEINSSREKKFSDAVTDRVHELKKAGENKTYKTGAIVHLPPFDKQTNGWQKSDLIILAGRPAMGKSAFALWCATQQARNGVPVGFISLEMSTEQLIDRIIASEADLELNLVKRGGMHKPEWDRFDTTTSRMLDYPLLVDDRGGQRITQICNTATNWVIKYGIKTLYIDYMQLIKSSGLNKNNTREQDVSEVSQTLKALAKNLNIPVIALSQLSRAVETRGGDKRPLLSDLRESGSIEQDADMVIFPFCENYYDENADPTKCELIIAKYRNGKPGIVEVDYFKDQQKFRDRNGLVPYGTPALTSDGTPF